MPSCLRFALIAVLLAGASAGCKRPKNDPVVHVKDDDPEMNAAIAEAKRRWPEFVTAFEARKPDQHFSAKYPFPIKGGGDEHIWLTVTAIQGDQVTGQIDNDPEYEIGRRNGETVTVPSANISDWVYTASGTNDKDLVGGFTIKVLMARQKAK